jgi:hypothetical protein
VKKWCSYILFFAVLMQLGPAQQLVKMHTLFEHFFEHQQRNATISVADFISMHYLGHDENDNDHDRDMELPFKKSCEQKAAFQVCIPSPPITFAVITIRIPDIHYPLIPDHDLPFSYKGTLFKPPRA